MRKIKRFKIRKVVYKKLALLILVTVTLASCGAGRSSVSNKASTNLQDEVIQYGRKYIGKPYRYASRGPNSFDCSGYTSFVFKKFGFNLSPSSSGQDEQVPTIRRKEELKKGDLVFFEGRSRNGRVGHVGIVTDVKRNGEFDFIHASTSRGVIVSKSTEQYYASRYLRGGRVIEGEQMARAVVDESKQVATKTAKKPRRSKRNGKEFNAYEPATAKKEPQKPSVPTVTPDKAEQNPIIQNEKSAEVAEVLAEEQESEQIIIVQTDSTKNPQLPQRNVDTQEQEQDSINNIVFQAVTRPDTLSVPKPVVQTVQQDSTTTSIVQHTVKMGETLYSISRQYNCSVEQLKQWNPQLGSVLKTGETLNIHP